MKKQTIYSFLIDNIAKFSRDTRGVSAIIIALLAIPIFGAVGLSVDLARTWVLKAQLGTALDSAGLAAGRVIFDEEAKILADAQKYFDANFPPGYMDADISALDISWDTDRENISLAVSATLETTFLKLIGKDSVSVSTSAVINRVNRGLELVMVLDNTGSMARDSGTDSYGGPVSNQRIQKLRESAKDLVDILYGDNETQENLWIGIVPYVTQVNVGTGNIGFLEQNYQNNIIDSANSDFLVDKDEPWAGDLALDVDVDGDWDTNYGWKGCVEMRGHLAGGTTDATDTPPSEDFKPYIYYDGSSDMGSNRDKDNDWSDGSPGTSSYIDAGSVTQWNSFNNSVGRGPNAGCPSPILPLTAEKTTIKSALDDMRPWYSGGTMGNIGMVWGWRTLSPDWRGRWHGADSTLPLDYDDPLVDKAVIMMTDGVNTIFSHASKSNFDYNSYSRHEKSGWRADDASDTTDSYTNADGRLRYTSSSYYRNYVDTKFAQVCEDMKSEGIIVFTIKYKSGNEDLYRNCATSDAHFFDSPTAADLEDAFHSIGQELSNLRIAQ